MPTPLTQKVRETIREYRMIAAGDLVVVAVSGGADSVALLHILHDLSRELECALYVAHLDHEIRGPEAREDAAFVGNLAGNLGLPFTCRSAAGQLRNLSGEKSLEEAARELRYGFLEEIAREAGAGRIATGHTMDDQAETVLMRILQGTGPGGLSGIRPVRDGTVIRPLIRCESGEIADYLRGAGLPYREDSTNLDTALLRNRVRHRLVPFLRKEFNPRVVPALARLAAVEGEVDDALRSMAHRALECTASASPGKITLALDPFRNYDVALQLYILRAAIEKTLGRLTDISFEHVQALLRLTRRAGTPSRRITLPGNLVAFREAGHLVVTSGEALESPPPQVLAVPGRTALPDFGLEIEATIGSRPEFDGTRPGGTHAAWFDWNTLAPPLEVRGWRPGDRFRPSGMSGTRKIQDFFVDAKVPRSERHRTALMVDRREIHWIVGHRTSEPSRVTEKTLRVLRLEASPLTASRRRT